MNELPRERLTLAIGGLAAAEGALQWTIDYVQERQAFGQAVAKFQNTRFKIAEMMTEIRTLRAFVDECTLLLSKGELDTATASMAKLKASELQGEVVDGCLQLFGGYGYMREFPISRAFVDARVQRIYGGTSEVMKEIIARDILGR
jgi:acyl-CoA dehydrogenase